jgi:hypothetical protein
VTEETQESVDRRHRRPADWLGLAVFGAASLCTALWLFDLGRGLTFFFDEWDLVEEAGTTGYWHNLFQPHNGHPLMIPFSLYEVLLHTVGLRHYWPYQLMIVLFDIACGWLLFVLLRRKVHPLIAGAGSAVLMLLGPAWQDLLWPFQIAFLGSVAGGLGALVLLDRDSRRADIGASVCLVLGLACSGTGLPFVAGVVVELAWRRRTWRRLWIPAIPLGLFIIWYEAIGKSGALSSASLGSIVRSIGSDTATTVGALVGRSTTVGYVLTAVFALAIVAAVVRSPGRAARLAMATGGLLVFWMLTLVARGVSQDSASRYLYPAAALVLIAVGELPALIASSRQGRHAHGIPASRAWVGTVAAGGVVVYAALAIWWNAGVLVGSAAALNQVSAQVGAELDAVTLAGHALPATFQPDGTYMPQVSVGPYLQSVAAFGSSLPSSFHVTGPIGATLDAMLLRGRPMEVSPISDPGQTLMTGRGCVQFPLSPQNQTITFTLPQRGSVITSPAHTSIALRAKSFSASFPEDPFFTVAAGKTSVVRWSSAPTRVNWTLEITAVPAPPTADSVVTICPNDGFATGSDT